MAETFPRWGLPEVSFLETDAENVRAAVVAGYEAASGRTLARGDPVRLFLLSVADIIAQDRVLIQDAARQNLLTYAQGDHLDALGLLLAVTRLPASGAVTTIQFKLSSALASAYTIPAGTEVTNGAVTFATDEVIDIPAGDLYGTVTATCTTAGAAGNDYLAGQISTMVRPMTFVESAQNISTTSGGSDIETDEAYAERIRLASNRFSVAGPYRAYYFWAKSVSTAIIDVGIVSPTPGEVDVYPLMTGGELPSQEILEKVAEVLNAEDIRPLTDYVQVMAPTAHNYTITLHYWISSEDTAKISQIKAAVEAAVETYRLWQQAKIGRDLTPDKLIQLVIQAGASRVDMGTLSPASFVKLEGMQVAQCPAANVTIVYEGIKDE